MKIFARHDLTRGHLEPADDALLLEGNWPKQEPAGWRWSLDEWVDGRYEWIDAEAVRLAAALCPRPKSFDADGLAVQSIGWLGSLRLRYFLVKLLRAATVLGELAERNPLRKWELYVERDFDREYELLIREVAEKYSIRVMMVELSTLARRRPPLANNSMARRGLGRLLHRAEAWLARPGRQSTRVVLCGNPRVLEPVCRELLVRGAAVFWLYERFALRGWMRWRPRGIEQLFCDAGSDLSTAMGGRWPTQEVNFRGIDLAAALEAYGTNLSLQHGQRYARLLRCIGGHFQRVRPTHLVLDQDASPFQRMALGVARDLGASSTVVQHGIPAVRFGFVPLEADQICVWNEASRQQLVEWGVAPQCIRITGATCLHWQSIDKPVERSRRTLLVFLSTPPADGRPDAIGYHLTSETYSALLRTVFVAARNLNCRLVLKLHPRSPDRQLLASLASQFADLDVQIIQSAAPERLLEVADAVVSCASTAGYEARLSGLPVIQLLPRGSADLLPTRLWRWDATARTAEELQLALSRIFASPREPGDGAETLPDTASAARRIVDCVLSCSAMDRTDDVLSRR